jgi:hypothetical protein
MIACAGAAEGPFGQIHAHVIFFSNLAPIRGLDERVVCCGKWLGPPDGERLAVLAEPPAEAQSHNSVPQLELPCNLLVSAQWIALYYWPRRGGSRLWYYGRDVVLGYRRMIDWNERWAWERWNHVLRGLCNSIEFYLSFWFLGFEIARLSAPYSGWDWKGSKVLDLGFPVNDEAATKQLRIIITNLD